MPAEEASQYMTPPTEDFWGKIKIEIEVGNIPYIIFQK
jgi:hypothetical protein